MNSHKEEKSGLSESFIIGVIAIVFLVVGYQSALFVHHAALTKIAANRDNPDTVYVYIPSSASADSAVKDLPVDVDSSIKISEARSVRKNSEHPPRAEAVRERLPRSKIESFRFNPNTISVEDLCRLGFSQKQAQAIDNYRSKGGRFRTKDDFARSYVVADSIFRRLESYIDIPLVDLNTADSAAFDALPGIGGWFASKIIEHRKALGGYSYKEQLMDIYRFDQEKYDKLKDLVTVHPEYMTPYPLWTLPVDSLRMHPYIKNYETAKAIVIFRENTPSAQLTIDALRDAGILQQDMAAKFSGCCLE